MRIFISTGEVSGDLQGAILIKALKQQAAIADIELEITALGGDRMKQAGATILGDTTSIGSVGLLEALPFVLPTLKLQSITKKYLSDNIPDALVLIDYAAPNIAIGRYVKKHLPQIPIIYYIAPQDWAVPMLGNAAKLTNFVDKLLAIFPQEANYYQQKGIDTIWVGHPLLDRIKNVPNREKSRQLLNISPEQTIITLLPASRRQEIKQMLPAIGEAAHLIQQQIPDIHFLIPVSLDIYRDAISAVVEQYQLSATIIENKTLEAIAAADIAITKSGTVNLEIALLNIPQVVLYRVHPITAWLARNLLKIDVPLMSPPNLIVDREIVPELQQESATPSNIANTSLELLSNPAKCQKMIANYQKMRSLLGEIGVGEKAAKEILQFNKQS
ncbi:Lipid-A-disaccharide synthase [Hyella patelloides LEGE 07179]|uniref:Lipid-A-disaccharide synthase n=1 Tax=Hyella patelloides LEGE 07179 TaxID=945734 RepID=A0A563VMS2_9CYAN|nr:lipid-A-disaccharide synthase [Hyella patelloides]VEP12712.1 Lipid-A-disaccharide synthase [Hyella patelloides LEGE 07179]